MLSTSALRAGSLIGAVLCLIGAIFLAALAIGWQPLSDVPPLVMGVAILALVAGIVVTTISSIALGRRNRQS